MNIQTLKEIMTTAVLVVTVLLVTNQLANAQSNRNDRNQQQKIDK